MKKLQLPELSDADREGIRDVSKALVSSLAITALIAGTVAGCDKIASKKLADAFSHSSSEDDDSSRSILDIIKRADR